MMETDSQPKNLQVCSRDVIKYAAMVTMFLNHAAHLVMPGTMLRLVMEGVGFFTAPVMCYFLVEGYAYTRSRAKYGLRLIGFAVISQIPFYLYFRFSMLNMFYTLFCCFLMLAAREKLENRFWQETVCVPLIAATVIGDWPLLAAVLVYLLSNDMGNRRKMMRDYGITALLLIFFDGMSYWEMGYGLADIAVYCVMAGLGIVAAGLTVTYLYNGKRAKRGRNFSKWFFYIFYPAHLAALYLFSVLFDIPVIN